MDSHLVFSLVALSFLSVFINGLSAGEISNVKHDITDATNRNDVEGLSALQSQFVTLQSWSGDPCSSLLEWYWVLCTNDPTPRITALYLSGYVLIGTLPDFSSMDALETIDLSNNHLTGLIPDFLGTLPNLQELNLENNDFRGTIPASLSNNNNLNLMVIGNDNLCASEKSCKKTSTYNTPPYVSYSGEEGEKKKKNTLPIVLGILIPVFILFWIAVGVFAIAHHKRKSASVAAMVAVPEMKGQEGEINMATHLDQQENTYTDPDKHVFVPDQQNVNP